MTGRPRIIIAVPALTAGGAEKQVVMLANYLAGLADVVVLTMLPSNFNVDQLSADVKLVQVPFRQERTSPSNLRAICRYRAYLRRQAPDLIISFTFPSHLATWVALIAGPRIPHMVSERNQNLGSPLRVLLRRWMYRQLVMVSTNTSATAETIALNRLAPPPPVVVIPNAVNLPDLPLPRRSQGGAFEWLCVARLDVQKGLPELLHACSIIQKSGASFRLRIVGDGPIRSEVEALVRDRGLGDVVSLLGTRSDVMTLIAESDAVVLSSRWEGLPNVLIESGAGGIPFVTTDVGGARDVVPESLTEFIVKPRDSAALAAAMTRMMQADSERRSFLGADARRLVREMFSEEVVMTQWVNAIQLCLGASPESSTRFGRLLGSGAEVGDQDLNAAEPDHDCARSSGDPGARGEG